MLELYYSDGGHAGPYADFFAAVEDAKRKIAGDRNTKTIEMRPRGSSARGGFARNNPGSIYVFSDGVGNWRLMA